MTDAARPYRQSAKRRLPQWDRDDAGCEWVREDGQRVSDDEIARVAGRDLLRSLRSPLIWADLVLLSRGTL